MVLPTVPLNAGRVTQSGTMGQGIHGNGRSVIRHCRAIIEEGHDGEPTCFFRGTAVRADPVDTSSGTATVGAGVDTVMTLDPGHAPASSTYWPKREGGSPCRFW